MQGGLGKEPTRLPPLGGGGAGTSVNEGGSDGEGEPQVGGGAGGTAQGGGGASAAGSPQGGGGAGGTPQGGAGGSPQGGGGAGGTPQAGAGGTPQGGGGAGGQGGSGGGLACPLPITESWSTPIDAVGSPWRATFGNPKVDVANHRLEVTYDDVAERVKPYEGSYYLTTTVTLSSGTVLAPYPYSNEGPFPSLRRSADGNAVELGMSKYGTGEVWSNTGWPAQGVRLDGTHEVQLTTYVKAGAKAIASKVTYGNAVYRSTWVSGFLWDQTNLAILRYVGQNNSAVYASGSVYLGPLSGCEKLGDAAVDALFAK